MNLPVAWHILEPIIVHMYMQLTTAQIIRSKYQAPIIAMLLTCCANSGSATMSTAMNGAVPNPSATSILPDTGQTQCYDSSAILACPVSGFPRQDAEKFTAFNRSATDSGATVTDSVAGLVWQRCPAGTSGANCGTGSAATYNWSNAGAYCSILSLAGRAWHLPSVREISLLADFSRFSPALEGTAFPAVPSAGSGYWTGTASAANGFIFDNTNGYTNPNVAKATLLNVRCVSGSFSAAALTDNGDQTVTDATTKLIWQKCNLGRTGADCSGGSDTLTNWQNALATCASLSLSGKVWRLPSVRELSSIIDYGAVGSRLNAAFFPNALGFRSWSSTTSAESASRAWAVDFSDGITDEFNGKTSNFLVRCITDMQ